MRAESHGDANSVSEKGAIGLMQVMPKTYAELRARLGLGPDPFDPHDNILAGAAYLADMFERYGETGFLAAYNAGPRRYEEYLRGRPLPDETTDYVARLTSKLSLANVPTTQVPTSSDTLHAPIFVSFAALKLARKPSADGSVNSNSKSEKAAPHPLFPARRDDQIFAHHPPSNGAAEAHFARRSSAYRKPFRRSPSLGIDPMTAFSLYRMIARPLAPLCASPAEGAQATELWQDKRDSLRLSRAVVLVLLVNVFAQAVHSRRSLCVLTSHCVNSPFFTSPASHHVS